MFIKSFITTFLISICLLQQIDAYWTVREYNATINGHFSVEVSQVAIRGNTTQIRCSVDIQPTQDQLSVTYEKETPYIGCHNGPLISLHGENRILKYLTIYNSKRRLNCLMIERTKRYKEYVCGNAIPRIKQRKVRKSKTKTPTSPFATSSVANASSSVAAASSAVASSAAKPSAAASSAAAVSSGAVSSTAIASSVVPPHPSPTAGTCILGYLGLRDGQGPNGACCTHSDDCLDTCVKGVCGVTP